MADAQKQTPSTAGAARLIAEMIEAQSWSMPHDCAEHPILGPAIALGNKVYRELRAKDFTAARIASYEAAVQFILEAVDGGQ